MKGRERQAAESEVMTTLWRGREGDYFSHLRRALCRTPKFAYPAASTFLVRFFATLSLSTAGFWVRCQQLVYCCVERGAGQIEGAVAMRRWSVRRPQELQRQIII